MSSDDPAAIPTLFQNIGLNFKGKGITQLTVSPVGDFVALAGKKGIFFVDLQDPWELQTKIKLKASVLEVHAIRFSKDPNLLATAHGTSVFLWKATDDGRWFQLSQSQSHRRTITDVSWSRIDQGFYTTCAGDGVCKAWDVRQTDKPAVLLKKLVDNVQPIKSIWSPHDAVKIATVNGNQVLVWDLRKTEAPVCRIFAATGEVTSLDWSYSNKTHLLTCSREHRFRIWSTETPDECIGSGVAAAPVDRGLYSPFGEGIVVAGKVNNLFQLFNAEDPSTISKVGTFGGNGGAVADFWWRRAPYKGNDEFQLVSWSTADEQLRLFPIEPDHLEAMGHKVSPVQRSRSMSFASRSRSSTLGAGDKTPNAAAPLSPPRDPTDGVVMSMEEEFENLRSIVGVTITKADKLNRCLRVEIRFHENEAPILTFEMTFPRLYPHQVAPSITIVNNFTQVESSKIREEITAHAEAISQKGLNSMESCIKFAQHKFVQDPILLSLLVSANDRKRRFSSTPDGEVSPQSKRLVSRVSAAIYENLAKLGPDYELYLIKPSDTIAAIALSAGMDRSELRSINGIHHSGQLLAGREIIVRRRLDSSASTSSAEKRPVSTLEKLKIERDAASSSSGSPQFTRNLKANSTSGANGGRLSLDASTPKPAKPDLAPKTIAISDKGVPIHDQKPKGTSNSGESSPRLGEKRPSGHNLTEWGEPSAPKSSVFKARVDLLLTGKDILVAGQVTLTANQIIFEPNLDDAQVKRQGVHKFTVVFELRRVLETNRIRGNGGSDDRFCLQIVTDEVQPATGSKTVHFVGPDTRITELSRRLESGPSQQRENALLKSLNLESSAGIPRGNSAIGRPAVPNSPSKRRLEQSGKFSSSPDVKDTARAVQIQPSRPGVTVLIPASADPLSGHGLGSEGTHGLGVALGQGLGETANEVGLGLSLVKKSFLRAMDKADDEEARAEAELASQTKLFTLSSLPEELMGRMLDKSFILEMEDFRKLRDMLPEIVKDKNWRRLFTTQLDGTSMTTFYNKILDYMPTLLIVKDSQGHVFGGFASEEWRVGAGFHGTGECFVFTLRPKVACYRWTEANEFFQIATKEFIAMGGGVSGRYAFYVDGEFCWGTSEVSNTFLNRRLSSSEEFQCSIVEVWTLTTDSDSDADA